MAREEPPGSVSALTVKAAVCLSTVLFQVEELLCYSLSPNSIF